MSLLNRGVIDNLRVASPMGISMLGDLEDSLPSLSSCLDRKFSRSPNNCVLNTAANRTKLAAIGAQPLRLGS